MSPYLASAAAIASSPLEIDLVVLADWLLLFELALLLLCSFLSDSFSAFNEALVLAWLLFEPHEAKHNPNSKTLKIAIPFSY